MLSRRQFAWTAATAPLALAATTSTAFAQIGPAHVGQPGELSEEQLGNLLAAMGLKPTKVDRRFDFDFKAIIDGEEWVLSMSTVLSLDGGTVWVMAWLNYLPESATDVPRTALLRLLARNDQMGNGKFFAYVGSNRRFVLQRVIPNEQLSTDAFREVLKDLGKTVAETHPDWAVENWAMSEAAATNPAAASNASSKQ